MNGDILNPLARTEFHTPKTMVRNAQLVMHHLHLFIMKLSRFIRSATFINAVLYDISTPLIQNNLQKSKSNIRTENRDSFVNKNIRHFQSAGVHTIIYYTLCCDNITLFYFYIGLIFGKFVHIRIVIVCIYVADEGVLRCKQTRLANNAGCTI